VWLSAHGSTAAPDLVFLALGDGYAVWTQKGARLHRLRLDRSRLRRSVSSLLAMAADRGSPLKEIRNEGRQLYQGLVAPLSAELPSGDLLSVLPDEEIASLPFHLLVDAGGQWLGQTWATTFASAPPKRRLPPPRRALVAGAPATREILPPLPDSRTEAEGVASQFAESTVLLGPEATTGAVTEGLRHADLFHYSGHGYVGASVGGLYLADGLLTSVSLQGLSLPACRLAVLSACLTSVGQNDGLTNPDSLVHALLDSGVRTVIASRWLVDSAATAALMARFYRELGSTRDVAQSLRRAGDSLRAAPKYEHPYFWAAFQTYE
jgi:CHAT domain-containing protein